MTDETRKVVCNPAHYADSCSMECIDVMEMAFGTEALQSFCLCNAFKYLWRYKHKNGEEDIEKALWYLNKFYNVFSLEHPEQKLPAVYYDLIGQVTKARDYYSELKRG